MEMSLIYKTMNVQENLISTWKVVHQDSFWNRGESIRYTIGLKTRAKFLSNEK